jgi:hypothetical protein
MSTTHATLLALALSASLGNGQESVPPPPPEGYGIQGNPAWNSALKESELDRAALAARQKKALMESMASVAHRPPVITSAEQYLQVHKPPTPAPGETTGASAAPRRDTYVPAFEAAPARTGRPAPSSGPAWSPASEGLPRKERSRFSLFGGKGKADSGLSGDLLPDPSAMQAPPPAAAYPEPPAPDRLFSGPSPDALPPAVEPTSPELIAEATRGGAEPERPSLFGRLFSREKALAAPGGEAADLPASVPPAFPDPGAGTLPEPIAAPSGIPAPPAFDEAPPAPPSPPRSSPGPSTAAAGEGQGTSSIFIRREAAPGAVGTAVVRSATKATVDGVLVTLHEGTEVALLERKGSMARVRLPDQREGMVASSALGL